MLKHFKLLVLAILASLSLFSCKNEEPKPEGNYLEGKIFVNRSNKDGADYDERITFADNTFTYDIHVFTSVPQVGLLNLEVARIEVKGNYQYSQGKATVQVLEATVYDLVQNQTKAYERFEGHQSEMLIDTTAGSLILSDREGEQHVFHLLKTEK